MPTNGLTPGSDEVATLPQPTHTSLISRKKTAGARGQLKLIGPDRIRWQNRAQFYGIGAQAMRRILCRLRKAAQRAARAARPR